MTTLRLGVRPNRYPSRAPRRNGSDDDASLRLQGLATNSWKTLLESGEIEFHPLSFGIQEGVSIDLGTAQRLVLDGNSIMFFHLEDDLAGTLHSRGVDSE